MMDKIENKLNKIKISYPKYPEILDDKILLSINRNKKNYKLLFIKLSRVLVPLFVVVLITAIFMTSNVDNPGDNAEANGTNDNLYENHFISKYNFPVYEDDNIGEGVSPNNYHLHYQIKTLEYIKDNNNYLDIEVNLLYKNVENLIINNLSINIITNDFTIINKDSYYFDEEQLKNYLLSDEDVHYSEEGILFSLKLKDGSMSKKLKINFFNQLTFEDINYEEAFEVNVSYDEVENKFVINEG